MTTSIPPVSAAGPRRSPWRAILVWMLGVGLVSAFLAIPVTVANSLRLERETRCVRDAVLGVFPGRDLAGWSPTVEVRVGGCALGIARLVARCVDLPDEARAALSAARAASVGVYQWRGADRSALRDRMAGGSGTIHVDGRDWVRVVSVRDGDESVVVLTPLTEDTSGDILELCVFVLAEGELVVVRVEIDPGPLADLVGPHLHELARERRDAA